MGLRLRLGHSSLNANAGLLEAAGIETAAERRNPAKSKKSRA
jgi:hypothetical protein